MQKSDAENRNRVFLANKMEVRKQKLVLMFAKVSTGKRNTDRLAQQTYREK